MSIQFHFFIFLFCLSMSPSLNAQTRTSSTEATATEVNRVDYWENQVDSNPEDVLAVLNLAITYQKNKRLNQAIRYYKKFLKTKSKLRPIALYYISKAYEAKGNTRLAKAYIQKVNIKALPKNLKKRILKFKNSLYSSDYINSQSDTEKEQHISGDFKLGAGLNTNPQYISADETTESAQSEAQFTVGLNMDYLYSAGDAHDWTAKYSSLARFYSSSSTSNYNTHGIALPYNYYLSKYRFQISPGFSYQRYSGSAFSNVSSLAVEAKRKFDGSFLSIGYGYDSISSLNSTYFYLDGESTQAYINWKYLLDSAYISFKYSYSFYNYIDSSSVSASYGAHQGQIYYGIAGNTSFWGFGLYLEAREFTYDVTESDFRKDNKVTASIYYARSLGTNWSIYSDSYFVVNNSNFDQNNTSDKNYKQFDSILGLKRSF